MTPKVSVLLITYNHGPYIAQSIEGVLMQRTTFPIEVVIGEDCSTDGTRSIVAEYQARYPETIRALLPERNQGPFRNVAATLQACRGQYVASLEGDDYWTDPNKLQIQADFLDSHPDCSICCHNALMISQDGRWPSREVPAEKPAPLTTIEDLILSNETFIQTCTSLWRRGLFEYVPEWTEDVGFSDWIINILNAAHGHIGFLDRCMAVYRLHDGGIWSTRSMSVRVDAWTKAYDYINAYLGYRYDKQITLARFRRLYTHALNCIANGEPDARKYLWRTICTGSPRLHARRKIALALRLYAPPALHLISAVKKTIFNTARGFEPVD